MAGWPSQAPFNPSLMTSQKPSRVVDCWMLEVVEFGNLVSAVLYPHEDHACDDWTSDSWQVGSVFMPNCSSPLRRSLLQLFSTVDGVCECLRPLHRGPPKDLAGVRIAESTSTQVGQQLCHLVTQPPLALAYPGSGSMPSSRAPIVSTEKSHLGLT